jgi:DNA-binding response OmpR family regulator
MANQPHILVVEDDPLVSEVVMDALDGTYRTSGAETAAAALECLRTGGIDAMLLDCTLPAGSTRIWCRWPTGRVCRSS